MYDDNGVEEVEKGNNDDNVEEGDDCDESRNCSSTPSPAEAEFCVWRIHTDAAVRQHTITFHLGEEVGNHQRRQNLNILKGGWRVIFPSRGRHS